MIAPFEPDGTRLDRCRENERCYGQALGKTANLGVISAVFFKERVSYKLDRAEEARDRQQASTQR